MLTCDLFCVRTRALQTDSGNFLVRRIDVLTGNVSVLAGTLGVVGMADGTSALFFSPNGIAMDALGTVALVVSVVYNFACADP